MKVSCCRFQKLILKWSLMQLHYKRQKVRALFFLFVLFFTLDVKNCSGEEFVYS